jgi:hypothetical protein
MHAGDGVALYELGGAVHGAVEGALVLQVLAAPARVGFVDQAGREVGIDRHLLARHGIQAEAGGHFGDAAGALVDDHQADDGQDDEDDDADDEVAAHEERAERLDDLAGGVRSGVAVRQDEARRRQVQGQPDHRGDQQHGRERTEVERPPRHDRDQQDQGRQRDRGGEADIEQEARDRDHQHADDDDDEDGEQQVALPEDVRQPTQPQARRPCSRRSRRHG